MGNALGIDLGTTNSVAAFKFAQVEVVTASDNKPPERKLTPSVVSLNNNQLIVGEEAYRQLKADPENVIISIKRLVGRGFADDVVQKQLSRFGYKINQCSQGTENSLAVWLGKKEYTPEDISALILQKIVENAQTYQNQRGQQSHINQAVVTIPAYFNDKQRYATQTAAHQAGLINCELLPEPTAAAISYGFKPDSEEVNTILVYDFGGGTFDSSLITAVGNQFIESGKAGDLWLGGDDIDQHLMNFVKAAVAKEEDLDDVDSLIAQMPHYQKVRFLGDLKIAVERAKIDLSSATSAQIIPSTPLVDDLGMTIPINVTITREQFEAMILPLIERSIVICQDAIKYSDYPEDMVDVVLLVGGSAQIPLVQEKVKQAFGSDKVIVHPRPMYAVAEGAAIVAAGLTEKVSTVSRDYFIELVDDPRYKLVKQGDILPVRKSYTFRTAENGQSLIHFKFFSPDQVSESIDLVKRDEKIGEMWLALNQPYPKGTEVLVTAELDEKNSSVSFTAALRNDPSIKISCSFSRGGEDEKISAQVEDIIQEVNQSGILTDLGVKEANKIAGEIVAAANQIRSQDGQIQRDRLRVAQNKLKDLEALTSRDRGEAQYFLNDLNFVLTDCTFLVPEDQVKRIQKLVKELENSLNTNNLSTMQKAIEDARQEHKKLPEEVQMILLFRYGINKASYTNPNHANAMNIKLWQMLDALKSNNISEAERLWKSLGTEIRPYLDQELPSGTIATGLTK